MKSPIKIFIFLIFFASNLIAQSITYEGADKCKICHNVKAKGSQYDVWKNNPHAKAFETLASPKAIEIAKKKGIENPQRSDQCLKCHLTAYNVDKKLLGKRFKISDGVGCESCHGAGGQYSTMPIMKKLNMGEIDGESVGLIKITEKVCLECHNKQSPTFKGFDYDSYTKNIAHPLTLNVK